MSVPKTITDANLRGFRDQHAKAKGYGCHPHPYLIDTMRTLAGEAAWKKQAPATLLDYGCGKGAFLDEMQQLNLFGAVAGYDPAVDAYRMRPRGTYDVVTCLDVLDVVERRFAGTFLEDIAGFAAGGVAVFVVATKPPPGSGFKTHPPFHWSLLVGQHMRVIETKTDFTAMGNVGRMMIKAKC